MGVLQLHWSNTQTSDASSVQHDMLGRGTYASHDKQYFSKWMAQDTRRYMSISLSQLDSSAAMCCTCSPDHRVLSKKDRQRTDGDGSCNLLDVAFLDQDI